LLEYGLDESPKINLKYYIVECTGRMQCTTWGASPLLLLSSLFLTLGQQTSQ